MRLAYLCSRYPWISHTFVLREVAALRRRGIEIDTYTIVAATPDHLLAQADRDAFATTTALRPARPRAVAGALWRLARSRAGWRTAAFALSRGRGRPRDTLWQSFYLVQAELLRAELARRGHRHVHVHFANPAADVALLAARLSAARGDAAPLAFSFTMHGPTEFLDPEGNRLAEKAREAAFVVCISEYARAELERVAGPEVRERLEVVHCGVDADAFRPAARGGGDPPVILCVGRLVAVKGQDVLLEAFARLRAGGSDARLVLVGDGETRAALAAQAARLGVGEAVQLTGAVGQDDIARWYARADVFCLPSYAEGVPVVLMEAMATELPVVTTTVAGIPELVQDGVSGRLVAPGDAGALTDALSGLLADPAARRRMGAAGRARVLEAFEVDGCATALHEVYARRLPTAAGTLAAWPSASPSAFSPARLWRPASATKSSLASRTRWAARAGTRSRPRTATSSSTSSTSSGSASNGTSTGSASASAAELPGDCAPPSGSSTFPDGGAKSPAQGARRR
jgi:glycosyltransferase involved in cell wall biosynthesis